MRKPAPKYPTAPWTFGEYIAWRTEIEHDYDVFIQLEVYEVRTDEITSFILQLVARPLLDGEQVAGLDISVSQSFSDHHTAISATSGANLLFALRARLEELLESFYEPA